jgi:hypothetical protein
VWAQRKKKLLAQTEPSLDCETYLNGRKKFLDQKLKKVAKMPPDYLLFQAAPVYKPTAVSF